MTGTIDHCIRARHAKLIIISLLSVFSLIAPLLAVESAYAADIKSLVSDDVREFVDSKEQISGSSTVGVLYLHDNDQVKEDQLYAKLDVRPGDILILKINSIDGRYSCEVKYHIEEITTGWRRLTFESDQKTFIRKYSPDEIAGLLTDSRGEISYPLRWGEGKETNKLRIYINSERARTFYYTKENGRKSAKFCSKSSLASGFKFNSLCDVPVSDIQGATELNIHRKFGIRPLEPIQVKLSLSGNP